MDDFKLRQGLEEAAARETGPMRAMTVLRSMHRLVLHDQGHGLLSSLLETGMVEVSAFLVEDAKRPSYQSDREAIERVTVQRDNAEARAADLQQRLDMAQGYARAIEHRVADLERRLKAAEERIPPSNASDEAMAPEPPASLKALVERWRLLSHQRRIALQLGDGDTTDFAQCAAELEDVLEDVLAKKKLLLTSIYNPRVQADLETMRKRAESAEQTLQLIKDNLP